MNLKMPLLNVYCCDILQIKCYQYWPCGEEYGQVSHLEFGNFRIYYLQELRNEYFTIRSLELENILVSVKSILIDSLIEL